MNRSKLLQPTVKKAKQPVTGLFCNYSHRTCMHNRLDGYEFCVKHILEDKCAPFKQCSFISLKNGKRCINAAPKSDKRDGYCAEHAKTTAVMRQKSSRKRQPSESAETLLECIDHYKFNDVMRTRPKLYSDSHCSKILEYASSSDSDADTPVVDQAWRGDGESDAESIDSEQEDYLKYAGIYTAEEVALITRDKLIRLQSLYIDQFKRLQHIMKEKRRKYLHTYQIEKESLGSIKDYKINPETRTKYEKLKFIKRYHRRYGKEALLHRQSKQRRIAVSEGANYRPPSYPKCVNMEGNSKCAERALPLSKYCMKHIMNDTHQALFRQCNFGNTSCSCPVASWEEDAYCHRHTPLNDIEPRVHLVEGEKEETLVLTKEALENLLPDLELNSQDMLLGTHILGQNPEFPDMIFSGSDHEQSDKKQPHESTGNETLPPNGNINEKKSDAIQSAETNGSCDATAASLDSGNSQSTPAIDNVDKCPENTQESSEMETDNAQGSSTQEKTVVNSDVKENGDVSGEINGERQASNGDNSEPMEQTVENGEQ